MLRSDLTILHNDDDAQDDNNGLPPQSKRIPVNSVILQSGRRISISRIDQLSFFLHFDLTSESSLLSCTALLVILSFVFEQC